MIETALWIIAIVGFFASLVFVCAFRVPDIHLGLPSDLFRGRIGETDKDNFSIPIREPYAEGLNFKLPWWTVTMISREVVTRRIPEKEFQVCGTACATSDTSKGGRGGGSVKVSVTIQYRPSKTTLYRFVEVDLDALHAGLDAEVDYVIGQEIGATSDYETAATMRPTLSAAIYRRFNSLQVEKDVDGNPTGKNRILFGRNVTYAEHNYGIEILKVSIDNIILPDELNQARMDEQKEIYQRESETTEWVHLLEKAKMLKKELPDLTDEQAFRAVQVWRKQYTYELREVKVDAPDAISSLIATAASLFKDKKPGDQKS